MDDRHHPKIRMYVELITILSCRLTFGLQTRRMDLCIAAFIREWRTSTSERKGGEEDGAATGHGIDEERQNDGCKARRDDAHGYGHDAVKWHEGHDGWHGHNARWHDPHDDGRRSHDTRWGNNHHSRYE